MAIPAILPAVHKIAVLRANALGDLMFTLPAFHALREAYPNAEIVCLGRQWHAEFIPHHVPDINRVVVVPSYPGVSIPGGKPYDTALAKEFFGRMQQERFDLAFQLHGGGGNSNPFVSQLGARRTFGAVAPGAPALDVSVPYSYYHNDIQRWLEVVSYAGAFTADTEPHLVVTSHDHEAAERVLRDQSLQKPYIIIHPGASDPRRRWPPEKFAWVARELGKRNYAVVLVGVKSEEPVLAHIYKLAPTTVVLCDKLSLGGLAALLQKAEVVIANDSGPLHMAAAVGAKTVGIYWIGNVIMAAEPTRSGKRLEVDWATVCPQCGRSCVQSGFPFDASACSHQVSFVSNIKPEAVLQDAIELLHSKI